MLPKLTEFVLPPSFGEANRQSPVKKNSRVIPLYCGPCAGQVSELRRQRDGIWAG